MITAIGVWSIGFRLVSLSQTRAKHTIPIGPPNAFKANPSALPPAAQFSRLCGASRFAVTLHATLNVSLQKDTWVNLKNK